jgi:adenine phosphoribosyltransferase
LPKVIIGLDSGGIVPTVALSLQSGIPYQIAYKLDLDLPNKLCFEEPGAVNPHIFLYAPPQGMSAIVVDDEASTGVTLENAIRTLISSDVSVQAALCLVTIGEDAKRRLNSLGIPLITVHSVDLGHANER